MTFATNGAAEGPHTPRATLQQKIAYGLGTVGIATLSVPVSFLMLYYLTQISGLSPALAGAAVGLPKIWDALVDPLLGGWVDRLALRMKRRTLINIMSATAYVLSFIFLFSLPQVRSSGALVIISTLLLISFSVSQTGFSVSQYALAGEMTRNSVELSGLLSLANVFGQLVSTAGVALTPIIVNEAGGGKTGYTYMAIALAAVASGAMTIFTLSTRSVPVKVESHETESFPLLTAIRATGANRPFYLLIAFLICQGIGTSVLFAFLPFANQFVLHGSSSALSILVVLLRVAGLSGMVATPWLVSRFGDTACLRWSNWLTVAAFILMFASSYSSILATWISIALVGAAAGVNYVVLQTTVLEVSQMGLKGGIVIATGFYFGIMIAANKLTDSAGGFAAGELLNIIGYISGSSHQSLQTVQGLRFGYTVAPATLALMGAFFLQMLKPFRPHAEGVIG